MGTVIAAVIFMNARCVVTIGLGALLVGVPSARALDLTNTWAVTVAAPTCNWTLAQSGSALTLVSGTGCLPHYVITASGTVDTTTATFTAAGTITTDIFSMSIFIAATVSADETAFEGTLTAGADALPITGSLCRNGNLDPGEQCDGGTSTLDCCSDGCTVEPDGRLCAIAPHDQCATDLACAAGACVGTPKPAGTVCWADGTSCTIDECDGAGACISTCSPCCASASGCGHGPVLPADCAGPERPRSVFVLKTGIPDDGDKVVFRLPRTVGPYATAFGDPTAGTDYTLCVVAGDDDGFFHLLLTARIPAAGTCGSVPCWTQTPRGYRYVDRFLTPDGVRKVKLAVVEGKAAIRVVGRGSNLSREAAPIPPVHWARGLWVQLRSPDHCWGAYYEAPEIFEPGYVRAVGGE